MDQRDGLHVDAELTSAGELVIRGHDLSGAEYEYALTIERPDVARLAHALEASDDAGVLAALQDRAETLIGSGEATWLREHGVHFEIWTRFDTEG